MPSSRLSAFASAFRGAALAVEACWLFGGGPSAFEATFGGGSLAFEAGWLFGGGPSAFEAAFGGGSPCITRFISSLILFLS